MVKLISMALCLAAVAWAQLEEKEAVQRTFQVAQPRAARRLEVDNVSGSIRVTGYDGSEVQVTANKTITADSQERMEAARREVKLDIEQHDNTVRLYVDGPFRCHCEDGGNGIRWRDSYGYKVNYDFEIKTPRDSSVLLRTVNHGDIKVENIWGDYEIHNVNGSIEMAEAAGSGKVRTVNGRVSVTFRKNPAAASSFGSINGAIDLYFQPDLSADLRMKTFNGKIYTDFPVTYLPPQASQPAERRDGKFLFKADRFTGARVGKGGPEIQLDGFNGDIRIRQRGA